MLGNKITEQGQRRGRGFPAPGPTEFLKANEQVEFSSSSMSQS